MTFLYEDCEVSIGDLVINNKALDDYILEGSIGLVIAIFNSDPRNVYRSDITRYMAKVLWGNENIYVINHIRRYYTVQLKEFIVKEA